MLKGLSSTLVLSLVAACGSDSSPGPTDVQFGDTAVVVVLNPTINDANDQDVPSPGTTRGGVVLSSDGGIEATTNASGIAVLAPLEPGTRTIELAGTNVGGSFTVTMQDGQLREVAVASAGTTAQIMVDVDYKSDQVTELTPAMSNAEVNDALAVSDTVVFFRGGTYTGDLDFSGSRVTLFGEGVLGGEVTIDGNVTVSGSDSRIRGTTITGDVDLPASGVGVTFSRVEGTLTSEGSDGMLLANSLCGTSTITGSGSYALDNVGLAPLAGCP